MNIQMITRADDFGSAASANAAILQAVTQGELIRNVSCMACGPWMEDGANELATCAADIDIGMHFTLTAEWDTIKWAPCSPRQQIPTLLDEQGNFRQSRQKVQQAKVDLEQVLREAQAQLDTLTKLGLPISYLDTHMGLEDVIPGLQDVMMQWCEEKGLLYAVPYYRYLCGQPEFAHSWEEFSRNTDRWLEGLEAGNRYIYVMHPAKNSPETQAFYNWRRKPGEVAWEREQEYRSATDPNWSERKTRWNLSCVRYRDVKESVC